MPSTSSDSSLYPFIKRVLIVLGLATALVLILLIGWYAAGILLMLFAGVLFAIFLRGLSDWTATHLHIHPKWSLALVSLALLAIAIATIALFAAQVAQQIDQLTVGITNSLNSLESYLQQYGWGRQLIEQTTGSSGMVGDASRLAPRVMGFFSTLVGAITGLVVVVFVGLYLAAEPDLYERGLVKLVPISRRPRAREVLHRLHLALKGWLFAQLISMSIIGVMTMIGLAVIGIPLWFTLGLLAALLTFIPNIGPVLSVVPPALLALNDDPIKVVYVVLFYLALQTLESYFITPLIQQKAISLPPVVIISAQVIMGVLAGAMGLALATPLAAAVMVLVQMLYIEDVLGDGNVNITGSASSDSS